MPEKATAPHSSALAWKIPWMEEPGRLQSMGLRRVGHNWVTSLSLFTFMHWRRQWQPTPVFLPGESQRRGSLVGCRLWGHTESDTTEATAAAAVPKCNRKEKTTSKYHEIYHECINVGQKQLRKVNKDFKVKSPWSGASALPQSMIRMLEREIMSSV